MLRLLNFGHKGEGPTFFASATRSSKEAGGWKVAAGLLTFAALAPAAASYLALQHPRWLRMNEKAQTRNEVLPWWRGVFQQGRSWLHVAGVAQEEFGNTEGLWTLQE